jgi:hypothetical protein
MKIIACATVIEELIPLLPPDVDYKALDFGLHVKPDALKEMLQQEIDATPASTETVVLGYGLCSQAVVGLRSDTSTLVVPRVDDCIGIFLGSDRAYKEQTSATPGTYYLTKGWIEAGNGPFVEYDDLVARYGEERAAWLMKRMLNHYTRLALINTGQYGMDRYRAYARRTAERFDLRYEEIPGSTSLLNKLVYGPWDDEFIVVPPGETITFSRFRDTAPPAAGETAD